MFILFICIDACYIWIYDMYLHLHIGYKKINIHIYVRIDIIDVHWYHIQIHITYYYIFITMKLYRINTNAVTTFIGWLSAAKLTVKKSIVIVTRW